MARQVLPWVGGAIGAYVGGPAGFQIGFAIGSLVGNAVDPLVIDGPKLGEAGVQTSAEGVYRPIIFGTGAVMGNIICRGNRQVITKETQQGKGGGPITTEQRAYWTFAIRIAEGPITSVLRIWQDEKLVYDVRPESSILTESFQYAERFRLYLGDETQLPDPGLEAFIGAGNVPSYRGSAYIVFENFDLTDLRERVPNFRFEVSSTTESTPIWDFETWNGPYTYVSPYSVGQVIRNSATGMWIAATGMLRKSVDGQTWETIGMETPTNVAENPGTGRVVTLYDNLAYYSDDAFLTVFPAEGTVFTQTDRLRFITAGFYTCDSGGTFFYGGLTGQIWSGGTTPPLEAGSSFSIRWCYHDQLEVFVAISLVTNNLYISSDPMSGVWNLQVEEFLPPDQQASCIEYIDGHVYIGTSEGDLFRSDDAGSLLDWTTTSISALSILSVKQLWDSQHIYVICFNTTKAYSEDGGETFNIVTAPVFNEWHAIAWGSDVYKLIAVGNSANGTWISDIQPPESVSVSLSDIVTSLTDRALLPDSRVDAGELSDSVYGLVLAGSYDAAGAIRTLMPVYNFDASEHDAGDGYKIHFPKRGKPVVATLTIDDFIDVPDKTTRYDAFERPRVLHMDFQSPVVGYAPAKASPSRFSPDVKVVGEVSVSVPVVFSDVDEAWRRADVMLKVTWTGIAGEEEFTIPDSFLYLVPGDAIGVSLRGQVRRMLVSKQSYEPGILPLKLVADRQSNYTSHLTGIPLPAPTPPPPSIVGDTVHVPLDIPALLDTHDVLGSYQAASGQTEAWYGATIERSTDGGANYSELTTFSRGTVMGVLLDALPDASPDYTDTTNVVHVQLYRDATIDSLTDAQFLSEGGAFALSWDDSGTRRWELLQYRDAEHDSGGDWLLSHLLRGRLNTETVEHPIGAYFVLLDGVKATSNVVAHLNADLTYRATSHGMSPDGVPSYTEEYTGQSQTEWPVAHLFMSRVGDTITASCVPRHRFGTEVNPIRSVNWSGYRWTATDGSNTATFDGLADSQAFDATGWASPVTVTVAQINRYTGAGPIVSEQIA